MNVSYETRYFLMTTDQAPPDVIAQWLRDAVFAAWLKRKRGGDP